MFSHQFILLVIFPVFILVPSIIPGLPSPFLSDGGVLIQTWAAQRLVARAGQYGAHGRCVSLSPHLWHGLRLSVVSTHSGKAPPPHVTLDPVMQLMSNLAQNVIPVVENTTMMEWLGTPVVVETAQSFAVMHVYMHHTLKLHRRISINEFIKPFD